MARETAPDQARPVAIWLFATAALVFALVVVGGATRLTGSGLSITEWNPIMGVIPPLSDAAWQEAFHKYQQTTQYQVVNRGMPLDAFQTIYWWEWTHRFLGRLVGVVFAGPLIAFLVLRMIPPRLIAPVILLLALGALQGLVGWWMVVSGLEGRVAVAPERLAIHLGLALLLFSALIWAGLEAWFGPGKPPVPTIWRPLATVLAVLVYVQCLLGALVAGNQAGLVDNDWPLMGGRAFPADYWIGGFWRTLLHSQAAVQFNHRFVAYLVLIVAMALVFDAMRTRILTIPERLIAFLTGGLVLVQVLLGIATLMTYAPWPLSQLHQALAAVVLGAAVLQAWRARRA